MFAFKAIYPASLWGGSTGHCSSPRFALAVGTSIPFRPIGSGRYARTDKLDTLCIMYVYCVTLLLKHTQEDRTTGRITPSVYPTLTRLIACSRKVSCRIDGLGYFSYEAGDRLGRGDSEKMELGYVRR